MKISSLRYGADIASLHLDLQVAIDGHQQLVDVV
jgi:hypothetical protein